MNLADSQQVAAELEKLGYQPSPDEEAADVVVLNTCVVRQSAEDRAVGHLMGIRPRKLAHPDKIFALMGCMVGVRDSNPLRVRFPFVDVFMPPSDASPLINLLKLRDGEAAKEIASHEVTQRHEIQDEFILPILDKGSVIAYVPIIHGCNHVCSFCVIPYRRGKERSRSIGEIAAHVRSLVVQGVREVTLLGQIVDRYGYDVPDGPRLPDLLHALHAIDGLERIRFLTSHPNHMTDELLDTVAELPKVCEHIEVPVQAGDDKVLRDMKRGYTVDDYRALIERIRTRVPNVSIATDIIVGFPGETDKQFDRTYDLLRELKLDVAHLAMYSPRPNTASASRFEDNVPIEEKERRRKALDDLQSQVVSEINQKFLGQTVEVLIEDKNKHRWKGRTRNNKLVFFQDDSREWKGQLADVKITWTGPWSMIGELVNGTR